MTHSGYRAAILFVLLVLGASVHAPPAVGAIGRTAGTFQLSPTGAATYSIPIWSPPGPRGVQPHIALVYDSQMGMSYAGMGWSITGLSSIYRCTETMAQDGMPAAITLSYSDRFCMDGKRLRLTSSDDLTTYGQDATTYQTEVADFSRVTAHGAAGNGPASFTVQARNGWVYQYGSAGNSQVLANGSTTALAWWLNEVTDPAGNTMVLTYQQSNVDSNLQGATVPASISWTPSSYGSSTYNYTMTFNYQTLTTPIHSGYVSGTPVQNNYLLSNISIATGAGSPIKAYLLSYTASATTGRETLTSLTECTAATPGADCLYPSQFTYVSGQAGLVTSPTTLSGSQFQLGDSATGAFDFNGDGINDLAYTHGGQWWVCFGSPSGLSSPIATGVPSSGIAESMDGTGAGGFMVVASNAQWWYYKWNGSSFPGVNTGAGNYAPSPLGLGFADINGDGLTDIVSIMPNGVSEVQLNTTTNGTVSFATPFSSVTLGADGQLSGQLNGDLSKLDFYGDGQGDLILIAPGGRGHFFYDIVHYTGTTFAVSLVGDPVIGQTLIDVGDYNDDGCVDTLMAGRLWLSACNGNHATILNLPALAVAGMKWDGSGRKSVVVNNGGTLGVYPVIGNSLGALVSTTIPYVSTNTYGVIPNATGDGSDGLVVLNGTSSAAPIQYYLHAGQGQPPDLLSSASDGYANFVDLTYFSIAQGDYTIGTGTPSPGSQNYIGPLYVVNSARFSDPTNPPNATYSQTYSYYAAQQNLQGRGFQGFNHYQQFDSRNSVYEQFGFILDFPATGLFAWDLPSLDQAANKKLRYTFANTVSTLQDSTPNNQRYFVYANSQTTQNYQVSWSASSGNSVGGLIDTTRATYAYDGFGNPTTITTTFTDNDSNSPYFNSSWTKTVTNTPDVDTTHWCLTLSTQTQAAYNASNGEAPVNRTWQFPNPDTVDCRYTQIITQPFPASATNLQVTETLGYDSFGNINSDTLTGAGMAARTTTTNWGTTGQFPTTVVDPTGAAAGTSQFDYNFNFGLENKVTDPNGLITSWQYDDFGRKTQEVRPDQTKTSWNWATSTTCPPPYVGCGLLRNTVDVLVQDTGGNTVSSSVSAFDPLERPFDVEYMTLTGGSSAVLSTYDSLGRLSTQTLPFIWGSTQYTQRYYHDLIGRTTLITEPASAANSTIVPLQAFQFAGRTTTITDANGNNRILVTDVNGWLRKTKDATNYAITLGYDAAGSKTSVTDSLGNTLWSGTYFYGLQAFNVTANDADMGNWTYGFDALGEMTSWQDAKQQSFSMSYDALSRPLTRSEPDLFTQWTWGSSAAAHEIGQLHSVCTGTGTNPTQCNGSGYAESETYDGYGRSATRSIQIPGDASSPYTYAWGYSPTTGLLTSLTYPATSAGYRLQVQYAYANGFLQSIRDVSDPGNVALWTGNSVDARGNYLQETFSNGIVVNHSFDAVTNKLSSVTAGPSGGTLLQNNSYLFDGVGNLIERQDNVAGETENVYPDSLNRLDHTVGDTNTQMSYDSMGRLATRTVSGTTVVNDYATPQSGCTYYAYSQPHAFRKGTSSGGVGTACYDANGNRTVGTWQGALVGSQTWTSYNQPNHFIVGGASSQFSYDHNHQRWLQVANISGAAETTEYIGGSLEKVTESSGTAYRYYVPAGNNFIVYNRWSSGTNALNFVTRDHLGSSALITDATGAAVVREKFSALGSNENSSAEQTTIAGITRHQFTGAETTDIVYTNMNGRMYAGDSLPGTFNSPDPRIPNPGDTRSYNRYAYVNYNPLTEADPTGFDDCDFCNYFSAAPIPAPWGPVVTSGMQFSDVGPSFDLEAVPNVQTLTFDSGDSYDQEHVTFYRAGSAEEIADFNVQSGKFSWADGWAPNSNLVNYAFRNYGSFGMHVQAAAVSTVNTFRNDAVSIGAAELLGTGISSVVSKAAQALKGVVAASEGASATADTPVYCFPKGTEVETTTGQRPIEDIKVGDKVMAYDFEQHRSVERTVTALIRKQTRHWYRISVGDETIKVTGGHRFWVADQNQWVHARDLKSGMQLEQLDGSLAAIDAVTREDLPEPQDTYNLEVEHDHDYFAGTTGHTVLVHNTDPYSIYFSRDPSLIQGTDTFLHGPWANRTLADAVQEAQALGRLPEGLQLNASWVNDTMVAANNRTLWVAQQAGLDNVSVSGLDSNSVAKTVQRHLMESGGPFCAP